MFNKNTSNTFGHFSIDRLFFILSLLVLLYFVFSTFGFSGDVKDRVNYEMTFENMNDFESVWDIFFGSSILYGLFLIFGSTSFALSIYSMVFLILKIFFIKKIFDGWIFVFLYLIKFAFVIDIILLKESLTLLLILFSISTLNIIGRKFYFTLAFFTHISALSLFLIELKKMSISTIVLALGAIGAYFFISNSLNDFSYLNYFLLKSDGYYLELNSKSSFLISNPIFWVGVILMVFSIYIKKFNSRILCTQLFSVFMGLLHPILGVPAFRFWQFSSFADLLCLKYLNSNKILLIYILPNLLLFFYSAVYLKNFLN